MLSDLDIGKRIHRYKTEPFWRLDISRRNIFSEISYTLPEVAAIDESRKNRFGRNSKKKRSCGRVRPFVLAARDTFLKSGPRLLIRASQLLYR